MGFDKIQDMRDQIYIVCSRNTIRDRHIYKLRVLSGSMVHLSRLKDTGETTLRILGSEDSKLKHYVC